MRVFINGESKEVSGTPSLAELIDQLDLSDGIVLLPPLSREILAAVYRQAHLVLQPSDAEGFGLPVIEALACGTPVVASDLPVLREVGGSGATYAAVADIDGWSEAVSSLLHERIGQPEKWSQRRSVGLARSREFTWSKFASGIADLYRDVIA